MTGAKHTPGPTWKEYGPGEAARGTVFRRAAAVKAETTRNK